MAMATKLRTLLTPIVGFEIGLTLLVILGGAFVRATGSGAGCGDHWPLCNGRVVPLNPKLETIIEFSHRLSSGLSLIGIVVIFFIVRKLFKRGHALRSWVNWALGSFLVEAAFGAILVLKKLVASDTSWLRALVVALHLVNTFLLLGALTGLLWNLVATRRLVFPSQLRGRWKWMLGGWCLVGAMGAVVALGDTLFPAQSLAHGFEQDLSASSHPLIRLRILHPLIAGALAIYTLMTTLPRGGLREDARFANPVRFVILAQLGLGLANWVLLAPVSLQLVHLLMADIAWMVVVWYCLTNSIDHPIV